MSTPSQWIVFGVFAAVAVVLLLGAAFAGAGRFGGMPDPVPDEFLPQLPDRPLEPGDLRTARFATVGRGYSQIQVDRLLSRAAQQWTLERDDGAAVPPGLAAWTPPTQVRAEPVMPAASVPAPEAPASDDDPPAESRP